MKIAIIKGYRSLEKMYVESCKSLGLNFDIIDVFEDHDWTNKIQENGYDIALVRPPCDCVETRMFFNDIIDFIDKAGIRVYPNKDSFKMYENKRNMAYEFIASKVKHPITRVCHDKDNFISTCLTMGFPLVAKSVVGSGSAGVIIIKNIKEAHKIARKIFGIHPALALGVIPKVNYRYNLKIPAFGRVSKHAIVLQKFIEFKWEWRIILIGNTISAYKKLKDKKGFASGSKSYGFGLPPKDLIETAIDDAKKLNFTSGALDYFESEKGDYYLNEAQCVFGSKPIIENFPDAQMFDDDGQPCIYTFTDDGNLNIVYGSFCEYECSTLRVRHALNLELLN
ncbi:hypothetical protein AB3B00_004216 [Vibrio alginolyticus]|uniref:ATP-grasp domain-containing protein n=1 Tax=Vibrio alginolyticus TaxID=663 RepID=UPI003E0FBBBC